jgi:uncharacterized protein YbjT (DUF2867 family)
MILVVGSTGLLGLEICRLLAEKNKDFRALVRNTSDEGKVDQLKKMGAEIVTGDLKDPNSLIDACQGIAGIISTASSTLSRQEGDSIQTVDLEGQLNLVKAAKTAGIEKFVYISFKDHPEVDFPLNEAKRSVEEALKNSGMNWCNLKASWFMEVWLSPALGFDYPNSSVRIYGSGENKTSWVSFKDVAKFAVHALYGPAADNTALEIGGPEQLSPNEVVKIFEEVQGKKFNVENVPAEALMKQKAEAADPLQESFTGLMIQYAYGDPIDMTGILEEIHVELISVRDYAKSVIDGQKKIY